MLDITWVNYKALIIDTTNYAIPTMDVYSHDALNRTIMAAGIICCVMPSSSLMGKIFKLTLILDPR